MRLLFSVFLLVVISCTGENKKPVDAEGIVTNKPRNYYNFQDPKVVSGITLEKDLQKATEFEIKLETGVRAVGPIPFENIVLSKDENELTILGRSIVYVAQDKMPEEVHAEMIAPSPTPEPSNGPTSGGEEFPHHTMFVTSGSYNNLMGFNSIPAGDSICRSLAYAGTATHGLPGTWYAVLSGYTRNANQLPLIAGIPIKNTIGQTIIESAPNIWITVGLTNAVRSDETGAHLAQVPVWTGTGWGGVHSTSCGDWASPAMLANYGLSGATTFHWLSFTEQSCNSMAHLYCINVNE